MNWVCKNDELQANHEAYVMRLENRLIKLFSLLNLINIEEPHWL